MRSKDALSMKKICALNAILIINSLMGLANSRTVMIGRMINA